MLARIDPNRPCLQSICLTPTRELANQIISDAVIPLSKYIPNLQIEAALKSLPPERPSSTAHLVVGTPGTILSWLRKRYLDFRGVRVFVLDEADEMIGPKNQYLTKDTLEIKSYLPPQAQVLLFSATYTPVILDFAKKVVPRAFTITLSKVTNVTHAEPRYGGPGGRGGGRGPATLSQRISNMGGGRGGGGGADEA
eukprot:gene5763-7354_t